MIKREKEIKKTYERLNELFEEQANDLKTNYDLDGNNLSTGILYRMRTYYWHQDRIKATLNKKLAASASDYFVETVAFYLKNVFKRHRPDLTVNSELTIKFNEKTLRPDISIFKGDELHSIIECKTQLGWNRKDWRKDFIEREKTIQSAYPNVDVYLAIMTSKNWGGLSNDRNENEKFFVLSNLWPAEIENDENLPTSILNPFEKMYYKIINK